MNLFEVTVYPRSGFDSGEFEPASLDTWNHLDDYDRSEFETVELIDTDELISDEEQ